MTSPFADTVLLGTAAVAVVCAAEAAVEAESAVAAAVCSPVSRWLRFVGPSFVVPSTQVVGVYVICCLLLRACGGGERRGRDGRERETGLAARERLGTGED